MSDSTDTDTDTLAPVPAASTSAKGATPQAIEVKNLSS